MSVAMIKENKFSSIGAAYSDAPGYKEYQAKDVAFGSISNIE